ncbi:small basic protein [Rubinisphaera sp. JC750]|uniref:small basic protein n=1 Tax=Rubinisphaera sp. JC750 TaxID=2898658 RepID=UPI001F485C90|nr:small basic protein [Rubinisphaera sp. JC750]
MSLDSSLKTGSKMKRPRNVLKRHERIEQLQKQDRWVDGQAPIGLPKVRVFKAVIGKKKKKTKEEK